MVKQTVQIFARIRPPVPDADTSIEVLREGGDEPRAVAFTRDESGAAAAAPLRFTFNRVFDAAASQEDVYTAVAAPLIDHFMDGYNVTCFAYGQTGSGKTFSITGGASGGGTGGGTTGRAGAYKLRGIIPRAVHDVFARMGATRLRSSMQPASTAPAAAGEDAPDALDGVDSMKLSVSYVEIYNECVYDLLNTSTFTTSRPIEEWERVTVREDRAGRIHLTNLRVYEVKSEKEALNLLFMGNVQRQTSETPMNAASSRSHAIFTLTLACTRVIGGVAVCRTSKMNLVDLAGSERTHKSSEGSASTAGSPPHTPAHSHARKREGRYINLSLHHLEQVILALQAAQRAAESDGRSRGRAHSLPRSQSYTHTVGHARALTRARTRVETPTHDDAESMGGRSASLPRRDSVHSATRASTPVSLRTRMTPSAAGAPPRGGSRHIPYRNSMLTSLLRDSIGGSTHTVLLATLAPEVAYTHETVHTCRFAVRVGTLTHELRVMESMTDTEVSTLTRQCARLGISLAKERARREALEHEIESLRAHSRVLDVSPLSPDRQVVLEGRVAALIRSTASEPTFTHTSEHSLPPDLAACTHPDVLRHARAHDTAAAPLLCESEEGSTAVRIPPHVHHVLRAASGGDTSSVSEASDDVRVVSSLLQSVHTLRLRDVSDAYACVGMLCQALQAAILAAAEAQATVDEHGRRAADSPAAAQPPVEEPLAQHDGQAAFVAAPSSAAAASEDDVAAADATTD